MTSVDAGPTRLPDILPRVSLSVGSSSDSRGFRLYGTRVLLPENRQISGLCAPSRVRLGGAPRVRPIRVARVEGDAHEGANPRRRAKTLQRANLLLRKSHRNRKNFPSSVHFEAAKQCARPIIKKDNNKSYELKIHYQISHNVKNIIKFRKIF